MITSLRLTKELIDQVVFGMENQDRLYFLDTEEGEVIPEDQVDDQSDRERYLELPEWRSVDGYNLMERFVAGLHNPIYRERLRGILASGRGVFRQFKDALRERPEIERRWFNFKEREMQQIVSDWFNDQRERFGLERLELEGADTETANLIESDFVFAWAGPEVASVVEDADREGFGECFRELPEDLVEIYYSRSRAGLPRPGDEGTHVLVGETHGGDQVAFLWAVTRSSARRTVAFVVSIYVQPEFRGLGLAKALLSEYFARAHQQGVSDVVLDLPGNAMDLDQKLQEYGLTRAATRLRIDLDRWRREERAP